MRMAVTSRRIEFVFGKSPATLVRRLICVLSVSLILEVRNRFRLCSGRLKTVSPSGSAVINTLFSLFHQGKKDINDAVQPWNIRNLTDSSRHTQYHSFYGINPAKFRPPGMPATCRYFCSQQSGELTGLK